MTKPVTHEKGFTFSFMTMLLSIALGILLALPFKVILEEKVETFPQESRQELASLMSKIQDENQQLKQELTQTRDRANTLEKALFERDEASAELSDARTMYRILSGLETVHGPGIRLTISEEGASIPAGREVTPYLIHQEDLLNIVNEMWLAGAEAIAIRSGTRTERLVLDSSIRCVGSLIDVNNQRMTPPFDIFAIGNPDDLNNALTMPGGVLEPLSFFNINTEIVKVEDIVLPPFQGSTILEYAKPLEDE